MTVKKHTITHVFEDLQHVPSLAWIWGDETVETEFFRWQVGFQFVYNDEALLSLYCFPKMHSTAPYSVWNITADVSATVGKTKKKLEYVERSDYVTHILSMSKTDILDNPELIENGDLHVHLEISNVRFSNQRVAFHICCNKLSIYREKLYTDLEDNYHMKSADVILRIHNENIYCHSQFLKWNSKVFRRILEGEDFIEHLKKELTTPYIIHLTLDTEIHLTHFKNFIEFLYTQTPRITEDNVEVMALLALEYDTETVQTLCAKFLRQYHGCRITDREFLILAFRTNCWGYLTTEELCSRMTHTKLSHFFPYEKYQSITYDKKLMMIESLFTKYDQTPSKAS